MKRALLGGVALLLLSSTWTACRHVSVCESEAQCARSTSSAGEGGALVRDAPADGDTPGSGGGMGGSKGAADAGASPGAAASTAGEAAGGGPPVGPTCAPDRADCDDSTLTVCETPTNFSFRHCGACDAHCDGTCSVGKCKPAENLLNKGVERSAANASALFALVYAPDGSENLHRFDLKTGAERVLAEGLAPGADLLVGPDRVYAFYPFSNQVVSLELDGSGVKTEAFSPETFGVTNAGVYYASYVTDPETEVRTWTLWFRARGASAFTVLSEAKGGAIQGGAILGSSGPALLVARKNADADESCETLTRCSSILLAHGAELTLLGDSPEEWLEAAPAADGAVFLLSNDATPAAYELVWLRPDKPPAHVVLEAEPQSLKLVPAPDGVALQFDDHNNTFVRLFSPDGAEAVPLGFPNTSELAFVDERYIWYTWFIEPDAAEHFQRSPQFELNDLMP